MRDKIYIWLPAIMLIYLAAMALAFKDDLIGTGRHMQFYITIAVELLVILLLFLILRKRTRLRKDRRQREKHFNQTSCQSRTYSTNHEIRKTDLDHQSSDLDK